MIRKLIGGLAALVVVFDLGAASARTDESRRSILEEKLLFVIPEFVALSAFADDYWEDSVVFLSEGSHTRQQRFIAIASMHKLSLDRYIKFSNQILDLHDRGLVSNGEIFSAILPGPAFCHTAEKNFLNSDVRKLLHRLRDVSGLSEVDQNYIDDILSGWNAFLRWLDGPTR